MKKLTSFLLAFVFIISAFAGCKNKETAVEEETTVPAVHESVDEDISTPDEFTLPISVNDSLNPYTCESKQNFLVSSLIYDSLVTVDENFSPVFQTAELISGHSKEYRIILKSNAKFSDGKNITADDVVYSFFQAKKSDRYKGIYDNVKSAGAVSGDIVFSLKKTDPYFANLLTFPIIPNRSTDKKSSTGRIDAPLGSGKYKYEYTADEQTLVINSYYIGVEPQIKIIRLENTPDSESLEYAVSKNKISAWYTDYTDSSPDRINGNYKSVNLNNLIYIGINQRNDALENPEVRRAISFAVDRKKICNNLYYEKGVPANGLFHPSFTDINISDDAFYKKQIDKAVEELQKIGYNNSSSDGILMKDGKQLTLTLLVNSDSPLKVQLALNIESSLRLAGIKANIVKASFSKYSSRISSFDYDLYIGEIKIGNNMDLSPLLNNSEVSANGITSDAIYKKYNELISGKITAENFKAYYEKNMPVIPLLYRSALFSYSPAVTGDVDAVETDVFCGIQNWAYNQAD